jgi:hypothetical protein
MEELGAEIVNFHHSTFARNPLEPNGITILSEFGVVWENYFFTSSYVLEGNILIIIALGRALTAAEILSGAKLRFAKRYSKI